MSEGIQKEEVETESKQYSKEETESYIKQLREENKSYRLKAKELEDKINSIAEAESIKKGEFEKLANDYKTKAEALEKQVGELTGYKTKYETIENETRKELLLRFPEGKRDILKDLPIDKLRELAKHEAGAKPKVENGLATARDSKTTKKAGSLQEWKQKFISS